MKHCTVYLGIGALTLTFLWNPFAVGAQPAGTVFEEYDADTGFTATTNGLLTLASYRISNGTLDITHQPAAHYNNLDVSKPYTVDLTKPTWFRFRFRMNEYLLGQDMYSTITFYENNDLTKPLPFTIGINSEQHWKTNYFFGYGLPVCEAKTADDEFFISVSSGLFPGAPDSRLRYPAGYTKNYTDWTEFSLQYVPPAAAGGYGFFFLYIDGRIVDNLHPIDDPAATVSMKTKAAISASDSRIHFHTETLIDGREHGYPGNSYGIRGRGCYAYKTPAFPAVMTFPEKFAGNDGLQFKTGWMKDFDTVAAIMIDAIRVVRPAVAPYQPPRSSVSPLDQIPDTHPDQMYSNVSRYYSGTVKTDAANRLWQGIYAGTADFQTAVYMGGIDLPEAGHIIWNYLPPGTRDAMAAKLADMARYYPPTMPMAKKFVWDQVYTVGGLPDIVHFGYLLPDDAAGSPAYAYLSDAEKATIPDPAKTANSLFSWDYFRVYPAESMPLPGDADGDGDADAADFKIWRSGDIRADFDKNGILDGRDYAVWMKGYTQ